MLAICGFSFAIRVIYRIHAGEPNFWVYGYTFFYKFAENIVAGKGLWLEGFGFAARPPIYPCFLALAAWAGGLSVGRPAAGVVRRDDGGIRLSDRKRAIRGARRAPRLNASRPRRFFAPKKEAKRPPPKKTPSKKTFKKRDPKKAP
jgi:hypothetical protein